MSFLLTCPYCGPRPVGEYGYGGELTAGGGAGGPGAPSPLAERLYFRDNVAGVQREAWLHRAGCGSWFVAARDTRTNEVLGTAWHEDGLPAAPGAGAATAEPAA